MTNVYPAGTPDVLAVKDGVFRFIEFKRPKGGRVSPIQKFIHQELRKHGATVEIIKEHGR